jgi:hypothetical protein
MPDFHKGKFRGHPVGWLSLNRLPSGVRTRPLKDGRPPSVLGKIEWGLAVEAWRLASFEAIVVAGVPRNLGRIELQIELRFPDLAERDTGNVEPTLKPIVDALGKGRVYRSKAKKTDHGMVVEPGRGVIDTDGPRNLIRPNITVGEPLGRTNPIKGIVVMTIRQLPAQEAAA